MQDSSVLRYVTGWPQLIGLIIVVMATLVAKLTHARDVRNRQVLVWCLLGLGTLGVLGGIGIEAARLHEEPKAKPHAPEKPEIHVTANQISGSGNAVGVANSVDGTARAVDDARGASVSGDTITGNSNAVGVGNVVSAPKRSSP